MKKCIVLLFILNIINGYSQDSKLRDLPSNYIKPSGWTKEFIERQERGLVGYSEQNSSIFSNVSSFYNDNINWGF